MSYEKESWRSYFRSDDMLLTAQRIGLGHLTLRGEEEVGDHLLHGMREGVRLYCPVREHAGALAEGHSKWIDPGSILMRLTVMPDFT